MKQKLFAYYNRYIRKNAAFYFLPLSVFFWELVLKLFSFGRVNSLSLLFILVFSTFSGIIWAFFCGFFSEKVNRMFFTVTLTFVSALFMVQAVYFQITNTFTTFFSAAVGANNIVEYRREVLAAIGSSMGILLIMAIPYLAGILFIRKQIREWKNRRSAVVALLTAITLGAGGSVLATNLREGNMSSRYLYTEAFLPNMATERFGMLTMMRLDLKNLMFGMDMDKEIFFDGEDMISLPSVENTTKKAKNTTVDGTSSAPTTSGALASTEDDSKSTPVSVEYADNVLEIDFDKLIQESSNETVTTMHEYFRRVLPTKQNEYTGMFAGKNLIWICAESFSTLALDPERTPTLWKLSNEGFVFDNFYNPIWGVSTSDGEYTTCTGLIPKSGVWSMYRSGRNQMPFTFGHQLGKQGYTVNAYHNNTYTYYRRDVSHPNMGYHYEAVGNGLELEDLWPQSDLEMMEKTVSKYMDTEPFHTYYMTVSGHLNYNFAGNAMAEKYMDEVKDLPYSEEVKAYLACNLELEAAVKYLIDNLESRGILEDTVIVLAGDHYPYGLEVEQMSEIKGHEIETEFEMYQTTLILWSPVIEEPIPVKKPSSPIDIMPTLSNLFGLSYDSRLLIGSDILSDSPGLVVFQNRSWISEYGRYDATEDEFIPDQGVELPEGYAEDVSMQVKYKFSFSEKILENDYYSIVVPELCE